MLKRTLTIIYIFTLTLFCYTNTAAQTPQADLIIKNKTIESGQIQYFQTGKTIKTQSSVIVKTAGQATFQAGESVYLKPGFHSEKGSKSYMYTGQKVSADHHALWQRIATWFQANNVTIALSETQSLFNTLMGSLYLDNTAVPIFIQIPATDTAPLIINTAQNAKRVKMVKDKSALGTCR